MKRVGRKNTPKKIMRKVSQQLKKAVVNARTMTARIKRALLGKYKGTNEQKTINDISSMSLDQIKNLKKEQVKGIFNFHKSTGRGR